MNNKGFFNIIVLIIIVLIIASLLGLDLRSFFESEGFQKNLNFAKDVAISIWKDYLKPAVNYITDIFDRQTSPEPTLSEPND